jgi:hypothetical protein
MPLTTQLLTAAFQAHAQAIQAQPYYYITKRLDDAAVIYNYMEQTQCELITLLNAWIVETVEKPLCAIREDIGTLCAFFGGVNRYPFTLMQREHMDVAVIYMLRQLTTAERSPKIHMAIRQWILATVGVPLLGCFAAAADAVAAAAAAADAVAVAAAAAESEIGKDICLAVAAQSIRQHKEDEGLRPWRRAVHLGRDAVRRWHVLQMVGGPLPTAEFLYEFLEKADTETDARAAALAAGIQLSN